MKIIGEIELSGIKRIVINRTSVWEREEVSDPNPYHISYNWRKTSGGPGMSILITDGHLKTPFAMMAHVNRLLSMGVIVQETRATKKGSLNVAIAQKLAYRCWVHGDTLNIVRKDLP